MFFGFAAYVAGHLAKVGTVQPALLACPSWDGTGSSIAIPPLTPELAILGGTLVAALLGSIVGAIAIRRQGIYFAMVTLALAQMVFFFCVQAKFTGGEDGIQAIPRRPLLGVLDVGNDLRFYYVVLAIFCAGFLIIYRTIHSPFGQVLKAIRENEARAISLGYAVDRFKLIAFVLSAALAGLAGATKAIVFQLASLTDVTWQMSGEVVLMTLVGGMGTVFGPTVGAAIIIYHAELPCGLRRVGAGDPGRDLRRHGPAVPARHRRRARGPYQASRRQAGRARSDDGARQTRS